jgi:hypothetical protein
MPLVPVGALELAWQSLSSNKMIHGKQSSALDGREPDVALMALRVSLMGFHNQ